MTNANALNRYKQEAVSTMSPARMIVALYDRLLLDLERAVAAIESANTVAAHVALIHAQEILGELHDSLDVGAWPAGAQLGAVYQFLIQELVSANLQKDANTIAAAREVILPLREAWAEASALVGGSDTSRPVGA